MRRNAQMLGSMAVEVLTYTRCFYFIFLLILCGSCHMVTSCGSCQVASCVRDCTDWYKLGHTTSQVYQIHPADINDGFDVYCDMETEKGGWLVFLRREDGSVDFNNTWRDYQFGFGNITGEHWLGNYQLNIITTNGNYELRVDLEDWEGNTSFAEYKIFRISDNLQKYTLNVDGYFGTAGDSLAFHNGEQFSTWDNDHDLSDSNCAVLKGAGWWYDGCNAANTNGIYYSTSNNTSRGSGIFWGAWRGWNYSLKRAEMKIRHV